MNYALPEIFCDIKSIEVIDILKQYLKDNLVQTVVKFYKQYESNEILYTYWQLVFQQFDEALTSNSQDVGKGIDIPFHHIERIYYQNEGTQNWYSEVV